MNAEFDVVTRPARPAGSPAPGCAWCGALLPADADHLPGRVRCPRCGAQTTWPQPSDAELDRAYGPWYRPAEGRFSGLGDRLLRRLRGRLARRLDRIAPPGPVLDVGAGDGVLLDALGSVGRSAVGLERRSERSDIREAELPEVRERWAAIVLWHSLEHLRDSGAALEHAAGLLQPEGALVVAMPNAGSIQARVFGDRWFALDLPRHLVHLPASALLARLRALGLTPERISYWRGGQVLFGWLHGLVGSLPGGPDLYDAIRRPQARRAPLSPAARLAALVAAVLLAPLAIVCAAVEVALRRGGSVYVEARRG